MSPVEPTDGRGGWGGRGAKSYDDEKAVFSVNRSMLSVSKYPGVFEFVIVGRNIKVILVPYSEFPIYLGIKRPIYSTVGTRKAHRLGKQPKYHFG